MFKGNNLDTYKKKYVLQGKVKIPLYWSEKLAQRQFKTLSKTHEITARNCPTLH